MSVVTIQTVNGQQKLDILTWITMETDELLVLASKSKLFLTLHMLIF